MDRIAVIGASGFVGLRLVETLVAAGDCEVLPVVRGPGSLASLARFPLDWRFADATDGKALESALNGCDAVVHLAVGDPKVIVQSAKALLPAAATAGCSKVVYMSTASVHGQNPPVGTTEDSPLSDRQPIAYNNAKVKAERILRAAQRKYPIPLTVLRPAIVFGPRDRWSAAIANDLISGTAYLLEGETRICNSIYVDNLVHAIRLALNAEESIADDTYLVTDGERVQWDHIYLSIAKALDISENSIRRISPPTFPPATLASRIDEIRASDLAQSFIARVPSIVKRTLRGAAKGAAEMPKASGWQTRNTRCIYETREMVELQRCSYSLPCLKAETRIGYRPSVNFCTGMQETIHWLLGCGYGELVRSIAPTKLSSGSLTHERQ